MSYILFDIGGTHTHIGVSQDLKKIDATKRIATPATYQAGIKAISKAAQDLKATDIQAIAGGIRGVLDGEKKEIIHDSILHDWVEKPFAETLKKELGAEVFLENDASLAGLGEAVYGAGEGHEIVVYHAISTGVGGAKIEDGLVDEYHSGFEPGHQILDIDHTILGDDIEPTLENLVSGAAVEKRMGMKPENIPQSDAVWDQLALYLAHGLRNSILYWSPDIIVLGGAMIQGDPHIDIDAVTTHTNAVVGEVTDIPLIVKAKLGEHSGLHGALAILNQHI